MTMRRQLLLAAGAALIVPAGASAADLPTRKAAPVEYVRVCDAYGAGFFYIPGTDTCLRVGGLVLAQMQILPSSQLYSLSSPVGSPVANLAGVGAPGIAGVVPPAGNYRSVFAREIFGYSATARIELDARTQSPFGTVRTFVRLNSGFGSGSSSSTGSLASSLGLNAFNVTAGPTVAREITFIDKAFIQFAGITAGRVQSFFDFYADAINYQGLKGSNSTVWAAAYTFTLGGGFSLTGAIEDAISRRGPIFSVINTGALTGIGAGAPGRRQVSRRSSAPHASPILSRTSAGTSHGAPCSFRARSIKSAAISSRQHPRQRASPARRPPMPKSVASTSSLGFAVQGGAQFNLDMLAPGDKLWLQATYARGAVGYTQGNNFVFLGGVSSSSTYGTGGGRSNNGIGWTNVAEADCVFTYAGTCDKSSSLALVAALKHYWVPTISSAFFGGYSRTTYSNAAQYPVNPFNLLSQAGIGPAAAAPAVGSLFTSGVSNFSDVRVGTNLVWTPVKNFDIGGEVTYLRYMTVRPFGLAPDLVLQSFGLPKFAGTTNQYIMTLRMIRAF